MSLTPTAVFAQTPKSASAVASAAFSLTGSNSLLDDMPQNTHLLMSAGLDGALVTGLSAIPRATCTASQVSVFIRKAGDPVGRQRLLFSEAMSAQTVSTNGKVHRTVFADISESTPLRLQANDELYVGLGASQANGVVFHAHFIDF